MGSEGTVPLAIDADVSFGMHRRARRELSATLVYDGPLTAPVAAGDPVGRLIVEAPGYEPREYPVVAAADAPRKGLMGRIGAALAHLIRGG